VSGAGLHEARDQCFGGSVIDIEKRDLATLPPEVLGEGLADAGAAARNQHNFSVKAGVHCNAGHPISRLLIFEVSTRGKPLL
jgi:hypothetical protein